MARGTLHGYFRIPGPWLFPGHPGTPLNHIEMSSAKKVNAAPWKEYGLEIKRERERGRERERERERDFPEFPSRDLLIS